MLRIVWAIVALFCLAALVAIFGPSENADRAFDVFVVVADLLRAWSFRP